MAVTSVVLPTPTLLENKDRLQYCDSNSLRAISVQNPKRLKRGQWILVYEARDFDFANSAFNMFV